MTAIEVSARLETAIVYNLDTLKVLFLDMHKLPLWTSALGVALMLRLLQKRITHPLLVPLFFMAVPAVFAIVIAIGGWNIEKLREDGWVFPMPEGNAPWWRFYTYFGEYAENGSSPWISERTKVIKQASTILPTQQILPQ